jgi:hypothetical protein
MNATTRHFYALKTTLNTVADSKGLLRSSEHKLIFMNRKSLGYYSSESVHIVWGPSQSCKDSLFRGNF